jgi:hypothetical protein
MAVALNSNLGPDQSGDGVPDVIVGSIGDAFWLMPVPLPVR